ncbi:MAG: DUF554 domain-containing protein [Candidatus Cloacimonetes bacterium]|nr:DUF554 domain-containing protein [Candidatus Cloacimonadota bacterium]
MIGTLINAAAVAVGSSIGLLLHLKLPKRYNDILFQGIGLFTFFLGIKLALGTQNILILIFSIVLGSLTGELMKLEKSMERISDRLKSKIRGESLLFSEGLITAFLLFCMGSMTILGAFEEGLGGKPNLLLAKSILDGFSSIALASTLGIGVLFSVIPLLIYQGGLTILARYLGEFIVQNVVTEITAAGGIVLIGLALRILKIKNIKILNLLPSLLYAAAMTLIFTE